MPGNDSGLSRSRMGRPGRPGDAGFWVGDYGGGGRPLGVRRISPVKGLYNNQTVYKPMACGHFIVNKLLCLSF
jgi:hypothetical protein